MRTLFVVCPCFNESEGLRAFFASLAGALEEICQGAGDLRAHVVMVDDGSKDDTWNASAALHAAGGRVPVSGVKLSRNFGHQSAICAGLDHAMQELAAKDDDTIVIMDSDGQHPPRHIHDMWKAREAGAHHVQMIRLDAEASGGLLKRATSPLFYRTFSWLSGLELRPGASDFRAFSGTFLRQYLRLGETNKFNRGLFTWLGFPTTLIPYMPEARMAGRSSYTFARMVKLASNGITYFSSRPLTLTSGAITIGGFALSGAYIVAEAVRIARGAPFVPGWPTILFVVTLWGSLVSLNQWLLSTYVARVFDEVKRRPSYIVQQFLR